MASSLKETIAYRSEDSKSKQLYDQALNVLPGGNSRHSLALMPYPIYVRSGQGCRVTDVEGEERVDFINNFTQAILGHRPPQVMEAVQQQLESGTSFSMPTNAEIELASLLVDRVDYIDKIRFCNSGSEAVMLAIKAARAFTGKPKIAKFEGAYHGSYDYALVSEAPKSGQWGDEAEPNSVIEPSANPSVADEVVVMPWNNRQACQSIINKQKDQLAAVVIDPLPCSMGVIPPRPGFLEFLREVTETNGIMLISDEVMSFRLNYHGACYDYGIKPDLTALAKIIGGGFPAGGIGGRDDVMEVFDHTKGYKVHHGGTFNANPVTMTAGLATMKQLTPEMYDRLNGMGDLLREKLTHLFTRKEIPAQVTGKGSLFWVHLTDDEIVNYRSVAGYVQGKPIFNDLAHEMLGHGVVAAGRGFGNLSTPMAEEELDVYVDALDASLTKLNYR